MRYHGNFTNSYERAAIIGYWRCGATIEQIENTLPFHLTQAAIKRIIAKYKNSLKGIKK